MSSPTVSIASAQFPNCYLRLDGAGVTKVSGTGGGTANCQNYIGPSETLKLLPVAGKPDVFNIGSTAFPSVFLRVDASAVHGYSDSGAGTVNCQYTAGPYEQYRLETQTDGSRAIASVQFPGTYLRMDGSKVPGHGSLPGGAGTVNAQGSVGPYERFLIAKVT